MSSNALNFSKNVKIANFLPATLQGGQVYVEREVSQGSVLVRHEEV